MSDLFLDIDANKIGILLNIIRMWHFSLCVSFSLSVHSLILSLSLALYCCHTICFGQFICAGMFVGNAKDTRRFSTMPTDILSHSLDVFHSNFLVACNNYTIFNSAYGTSTFKPFASANNMQNKNNLIKSHGKFHRKKTILHEFYSCRK